MAPLPLPLLLPLLLLHARAHLLSGDEIRCISASTKDSALARWIACLPPTLAPPEDRSSSSAGGCVQENDDALPPCNHVGVEASDTMMAHATSSDRRELESVKPQVDDAVAANELLAVEHGRTFSEQLEALSVNDTSTALGLDTADEGTAATQQGAHFEIEDVDAGTNRGVDGEVLNFENGDVYRDQYDALRTVLKLNVGVLALGALLIPMLRCSRNENKKGAFLRKHSSNHPQCTNDAALASGTNILNGAKLMEFKPLAGDLQPRTLGTYLGTAIGAVFAEVVSCGSKSCIPATELSTIMETAIRESLCPIAGIESSNLLENFMASFRSTYNTIFMVHQACSKKAAPCQGNRCVSSESEMSFNSSEPCSSSSDSNFSQHLDCGGGTDDVDDNFYDVDENINGSKMSCYECGICSSDVEVRKKKPLDCSRHKGGHESMFCGPIDVLERADKMDTTAECPQDCFSRKNNILRKRGECSPVQASAKPQDCMPDLSIASLRNRMTMKSVVLTDQGFSSIRSIGGTSYAYPRTHVQEAGSSQDMQLEQVGNRHASRSLTGNGDNFEHRGNFFASPCHLESSTGNTDSGGLDVQYGDDDSSVTRELSDIVQLTVGKLDPAVLAGPTRGPSQLGWQRAFLHVFEKSVHAQEQHNYIKSVELAHLLGRLSLKEEQLQLASASNQLMKENIELSRSKAGFKESRVIEQRLNAAQVHFSRTCADELVAGLFVMLLSLSYGVRRHSFSLLFDLVSTCKPSFKEPRQSSWFHIDWFYNSLDSLAGQLQAFTCQVTVAGRILIGLAIVAVVASSLLRQSVTSSSQSMPATIIIIVLGLVCGYAGKISVDSLGGSGLHWLLVWETFCTLHALANCCTPFVFKLIHGSSSSNKARFRIPFWLRRFAFHSILVLVLPVMAGQLPFVTIGTVMKDTSSMLVDTTAQIVIFLREYMVQLV